MVLEQNIIPGLSILNLLFFVLCTFVQVCRVLPRGLLSIPLPFMQSDVIRTGDWKGLVD